MLFPEIVTRPQFQRLLAEYLNKKTRENPTPGYGESARAMKAPVAEAPDTRTTDRQIALMCATHDEVVVEVDGKRTCLVRQRHNSQDVCDFKRFAIIGGSANYHPFTSGGTVRVCKRCDHLIEGTILEVSCSWDRDRIWRIPTCPCCEPDVPLRQKTTVVANIPDSEEPAASP